MPIIEGLRGPRDLVGGLAHFGRMIDKIRLNLNGTLPESYRPFLGESNPFFWDGRICRFLGVAYSDVVERVKRGESEQHILNWALETGSKPSQEKIEIITAFITKRGWRDGDSPSVREEAIEIGVPLELVACRADLYDLEEGRERELPFPPDPVVVKWTGEPQVRIPNLRSPRDPVGGLIHFGRMIDKIRLNQAGLLPEAWGSALGAEKGYDGSCCRLLRVNFADLSAEAIKGGTDDAILSWAFSTGRKPGDEQIFIWNTYILKRGWRDQYSARLKFRLEEAGIPINAALTMVDFIDLDEGREIPEYP